jgi:cellobiose phosphorylase
MNVPFPPAYTSFDSASEFIIDKPDTPRPWENRLWNNLISIQLNNHGGARVTERDLGERFYRYNESGRRFVYVWDAGSKDLWSPGWLPVRVQLDSYQARHGINYTVITGSRNGISVKWINTVHATEACELWRLTLTNKGTEPRNIAVIPFYEVGLSFRDDYFHGSPDLFRAKWDDSQQLFFLKNHSRQRDGERYALAYHSSQPVDSYELSTEGFLRDYGSYGRPQSILCGDFRNSIPDRLPPVFAMRYDLRLIPGKPHNVSVQIYSAESFEEARERIKVLGRRGITSLSLALHREFANRYFADNRVVTPDGVLDRFLNLWTKHQLRYNAYWNREEFGIGMRDAMQDCDMFVMQNAEFSRNRILEATRHIFEDGHTVRKWSRLDLKPYFDGGLWYVNTLCKYLKESGDLELLTVEQPFFDSQTSGTVLAHAKRAMDFLDKTRGPDGLCRMGFGDWNDALNGIDREGKGQSVWTSQAFIWALRPLVELLRYLGDPQADHYEALADKMGKLINKLCFEQDRYIRAINDAGDRIGCEACDEGKIYLNPQSWAMIAGIASPSRVQKMLKAVEARLYTDYGPVLLDPVYTKHRPDIGRITSDPPGFVENGANYVHAAMFHAYGLVLAGYPDKALGVIHRVLPSNPLNSSEASGLEPYMITNAYEGPASDHPGRAMFAWRTGSASWLLKVVWDGFLGILPEYEGLRFNPRLPKAWKGDVRAERRIRSCRITVIFRPASSDVSASSGNPGQNSRTLCAGERILYPDISDGMVIYVLV